MTEPEFLTTTEAAELLRVHRTTITRLIKDGKLAGTNVGSRVVIARAAIDEFVTRNTATVRDDAFDPKERVPRAVPAEREALRQRYEFLRPVSKAG